MSEMTAIISHDGKEIFKIERSVVDAGDLVRHLREMQKNTNVFLTGLIENSDGKSEEDDNAEDWESDEEVNEPEKKIKNTSQTNTRICALVILNI